MQITPAMQEVVTAIGLLPPTEQDKVAAWIKAELEAEQRWEELFSDPRSEDIFAELAAEARNAQENDLWDLKTSGL